MNMQEWIDNRIYSELIQMPLWTDAAFGSLKEGDVLTKDDVRYQLIEYLCMKHVESTPSHIYNDNYRHTWSIKDYLPCIKAAVRHNKKYNNKKYTPS